MKVSAPVSFGKAVRINASKEVATNIARLANQKELSKTESTVQKQAKEIFDDITDTAPAKVVTYPGYSTISGFYEEVFIVSGKEAEKADRLHRKLEQDFLRTKGEITLTKDEEKARHIYNIHGEDYTDDEIRETRKNKALNEYYRQLRSMLAQNEVNYSVNVVQNADETEIKSLGREYASVYAVAGSAEQIEKFRSILNRTGGPLSTHNATSLYKNKKGDGCCTKAANAGDEICFLVTGKENNYKIRFMKQGWTSINGISRGIERFLKLGDNLEEQAKPIIEAMKHQ